MLNMDKIKEKKGEKIVIVDGGNIFKEFYTQEGIEEFRKFIANIGTFGICLIGNIGITCHFCDIVRLAKIPTVLIREETR